MLGKVQKNCLVNCKRKGGKKLKNLQSKSVLYGSNFHIHKTPKLTNSLIDTVN
jgi:hypothetical protein